MIMKIYLFFEKNLLVRFVVDLILQVQEWIFKLTIMPALSYAVVWKEAAWFSRIYVFYVKSSFKCLWCNFFNGSEIFDKVIYLFYLIQFVVTDQTLLFYC